MMRRRGFTLVEMLIVGALIALFSGIAIIGIQAQYRANQRKAVIGETRQVASALDFAYNDVGLFPKISLLTYSREHLNLESDIKYGDQLSAFRLSDYFGITIPPADVSRAESIADRWRGGYFAASQARTRVSQGRGGSRKMISDANDNVGYDWPLDVWNNPYMLYCLSINPDDQTLYFAHESLQADGTFAVNNRPGAEGNFVNAVVSYGPNQVPGGGEIFIPSGNVGTAVGGDSGHFALRAYSGDPNSAQNPLGLKRGATLLQASQGRAIANAWTRLFAQRAGGTIFDDLAETGTSDPVDVGDGILSTKLGITDVGSDDVTFTF